LVARVSFDNSHVGQAALCNLRPCRCHKAGFSFQADDAPEWTDTLGQQVENAQGTAAYISDLPPPLNANAIQKETSTRFIIDRLLEEPLLLNLAATQRVISRQQQAAI